MPAIEAQPATRDTLREQLTATRAGFSAILDSLTEADLRRPSGNPAWTVGAVLTHLVWSLELLPREVASARRGKGMYNFPPVLRDALNAWMTRLQARGQTLATLRQRYDAAFATAMTTLDRIADHELGSGARFWSEGFRDIAGLYAAQADHLTEHADNIRCAVPRLSKLASTRREL